MTNEEKWICGYEGKYSITTNGVVKRYGEPIKQQRNKFGYMNVSLYKDKHNKQYKVHRLVAMSFIPNPDNKPQVNHIDGNKENNNVNNLEWCTCKENIKHSCDNGLRNCMAVRIVETGESFKNTVECAKAISGDASDIYYCVKGKRKTHKGYHFVEV